MAKKPTPIERQRKSNPVMDGDLMETFGPNERRLIPPDLHKMKASVDLEIEQLINGVDEDGNEYSPKDRLKVVCLIDPSWSVEEILNDLTSAEKDHLMALSIRRYMQQREATFSKRA